MKQSRILMGMPVTVEVVQAASPAVLEEVMGYFEYVDEKFSTYQETSEISRINRHELALEQASPDMQQVFALAERTRLESNGYFDIRHKGSYDPSGLVKGWAILNGARILRRRGFEDFYVEAGGDVEAAGHNNQGRKWRVGIRNPFRMDEIVKVVALSGQGIATSGTYARGQHIYNPKDEAAVITDILSLTVIGPNVYEADRFATAAFAMGRAGIDFIAHLHGFEGYLIDREQRATYTTGFGRYLSDDPMD